jgi:V8-like Glu-specific endopeptidase
MILVRPLAGAILGLSLAACSADAAIDDAEPPLIGGTAPRTLPPGIVALQVECGAVKIGPREFLTAGHCVVRRLGDVDLETLEPRGTFGRGEPTCLHASAFVSWPGEQTCIAVEIVWTKVHPTYAAHTATHSPGALRSDLRDLAVIRISRDTPGIPVVNFFEGELAPGDRLMMTGYGCQALPTVGVVPSPNRTLRVAETRLHGLGAETFNTAAHNAVAGCPGDSGAPVYVADRRGARLAGINSFITADGRTFMARTDERSEVTSWIRSVARLPD